MLGPPHRLTCGARRDDPVPRFEVDEPATAPVAEERTEQRTERLGSISVDDETARAAATGTPMSDSAFSNAERVPEPVSRKIHCACTRSAAASGTPADHG